MKKIILLLIMFLCSVVNGQSTDYKNLLLSISSGTRYASNPIISHVASTWKSRQVHYPFIIPDPWHPDSLIMYYGGGSYLVNNYNIGFAKAPISNPLTWTEYASNPILTTPTTVGLPRGTFFIGPHYVTYNTDSAQIWMYCTVFSDGGDSSWQGRFTSSNGITFTYKGAVLQSSGDETFLGDAGYIKDGATWYCYYTYRTAGAVLPGIRLATSSDGITWTKPMTQILSIGLAGTYDSRYIEGVFAFKKGSTFTLFYSCYNGTNASNGLWTLSMATSESASSGFVKDPHNPMVTAASTGWDSLHVATPFIYGDYLYYQGTKSTGDYSGALWDIGAIHIPSVNTTPAYNSKVKCYVTQTVYHKKLTDTTSNFLHTWKIPRTGEVLANCDSAKHVITYRKNGDRIPRKVLLTTDTVFIYINTPASNILDSTYYVGFGKELTESDSVSTFTKSGITNAWMFDETSGTTSNDYVGTLHQTISTPDTLNGVNAKFKKSLGTVTNGKAYCAGQPLSGVASFTYSAWVYRTETKVQMIFTNRDASAPYFQLYANGGSQIICHFGAVGINFTTTETNLLAPNAWTNVAVTYDGSGTGNDGRAKIYINGANKTGSWSGTVPTSLPTFTGFVSNGCTNEATTYTFGGFIDNSELFIGIVKPVSYLKDQYTLGNDQSAFYFTSNPILSTQSTSTGSKWSAYKPAFKSAFR